MTDRPSGESCGSRILGSSARSTSDIGRGGGCARIVVPGAARTARVASRHFFSILYRKSIISGVVEWGLLMSDRKYRQRGYQDEPRDREPRREKPAQEPRAPGRPL